MIQNMFHIKAKNPCPNAGLVGDASDLAEAIQLSFPLDTDDAVLQWNQVSIPISYKYDISVILEDVLELLESCLKGRSVEISFGSDTFSSNWKVTPVDGKVSISAYWVSVVGGVEGDLNKEPDLVVAKMHFVQQWSRLIEIALDGIKQTELQIEDLQLLYRAEALLNRVYDSGSS